MLQSHTQGADSMYQYNVSDFQEMFGALISAARNLETADHLRDNNATYLTEERMQNLAVVLDGLRIVCSNFDADPSLLSQIKTFSDDLLAGVADKREAVVLARVKGIIEGVHNNLASRRFMYIAADEAQYWENCEIFGKYFVLVFPKPACFEMLEAGKCFAAGRGTACVFHCMRVAEYGLRKLARKLKVTLADKGKKQPFEYGDWNKVITAIKNKIETEIRRQPNNARRAAALQFYSSAADHCEYMKDIWRNELMHTRRMYSKSEALGVINRVRDFIEPFLPDEQTAVRILLKNTGARDGVTALEPEGAKLSQ